MAGVVESFASPGYQTGATYNFTSVAWNRGDVIVYGYVDTGAGSGVPVAPTNANLTFFLVDDDETASESNIAMWVAKADDDQTGQTIVTDQGGTNGYTPFLWRVSGCDGIFSIMLPDQSDAVVPMRTPLGGVVCYINGDFAPANNNETPVTGTGTATERADGFDSGNLAWYAADWVGTADGVSDFGFSDYATGSPSINQMAICLRENVKPTERRVFVKQFLTDADMARASGNSIINNLAWEPGDVIVVGLCADDSASVWGVPTNTPLPTFTQRRANNTSSECENIIWTSKATTREWGQTITVPRTSGTNIAGAFAYVLGNASDFITGSGWNVFTEAAESETVTERGAIVIAAVGDWNAAGPNGPGVIGSGEYNERLDHDEGADYSLWVGDWTNPRLEAIDYGLGDYTGVKASHVGIVVGYYGGPVWATDTDFAEEATDPEIDVTLANIPDDGDIIVFGFSGVGVGAKLPDWATLGATKFAELDTSRAATMTAEWAWKRASGETSATYSIGHLGTGNHDSTAHVGVAKITGVPSTLTNPFYAMEPHFPNEQTNDSPAPVLPIDDDDTLQVIWTMSHTTNLVDTEFDAGWNNDGFGGGTYMQMAGWQPVTDAPTNLDTPNTQNAHDETCILTFNALSGGPSRLPGPIVKEFHVQDQADATALSSITGFTTRADGGAGTGIIEVDNAHGEHGGDRLLDLTEQGGEYFVDSTTIGLDDHWIDAAAFLDVMSSGSGSNQFGVTLRTQASAYTADADIDTYRVQAIHSTGDDFKIEIHRITDKTATGPLAASANIHSTYSPEGDTRPIWVTGKIRGNIIIGYLNGVEQVRYDIKADATKYTTGDGYLSGLQRRGVGDANSQPFIQWMRAGTNRYRVAFDAQVVDHTGETDNNDNGNITTGSWETNAGSLLVAIVTIDNQNGTLKYSDGDIPVPTTTGTTWVAKSAVHHANASRQYSVQTMVYMADSPGNHADRTFGMNQTDTQWNENVHTINLTILEFPDAAPVASQPTCLPVGIDDFNRGSDSTLSQSPHWDSVIGSDGTHEINFGSQDAHVQDENTSTSKGDYWDDAAAGSDVSDDLFAVSECRLNNASETGATGDEDISVFLFTDVITSRDGFEVVLNNGNWGQMILKRWDDGSATTLATLTDLGDLTVFRDLMLVKQADDDVVVYVNGIEKIRENDTTHSGSFWAGITTERFAGSTASPSHRHFMCGVLPPEGAYAMRLRNEDTGRAGGAESIWMLKQPAADSHVIAVYATDSDGLGDVTPGTVWDTVSFIDGESAGPFGAHQVMVEYGLVDREVEWLDIQTAAGSHVWDMNLLAIEIVAASGTAHAETPTDDVDITDIVDEQLVPTGAPVGATDLGCTPGNAQIVLTWTEPTGVV